MRTNRFAVLALTCALAGRAFGAAEIPDEFKDPDTGARILHVSRVPGNERAGVIYFTQGSATADSKRVLFHVMFDNDKAKRHLYAFDFATGQVTPIVTDRMTAGQDFSTRTNNVYYQADQAIWSANLDTRQARKIADLPPQWGANTDLSVNADETLLASGTDASGATTQPTTVPAGVPAETARLRAMSGTFDAHRKNVLYTVDLKSGELKVVQEVNTWLGHVQFSPTDPKLLMFCHEGPWERVDRIWTVRIGDGEGKGEPSIFYKRAEPREIAGHEIFGTDGSTIWFQDSNRAKPGESYLMGKNVTTGEVTKYKQPAGGGGVHQFQSPDGKFFIGDGGGRNKVLTLQEPDGDTLKVTKLASLAKNDYAQCEPNPHLTPDQHWCIFTATFDGPPQAYALEMPEKYWRK